MISGRSLDMQIGQHVVLILGEDVRRRYVVENISPRRESVVVRAFEPAYNPTWQRSEHEIFQFADYYRLKSRYGDVAADPIGQGYEGYGPYTDAAHPVDDLDGTAAGAGRTVQYAAISHDQRSRKIGAQFDMIGGATGGRINVTYALVDGRPVLLAHVLDGAAPEVRVIYTNPR